MYTHRHLGVEDPPAPPVSDAPAPMTRDSVGRGARPIGFSLPRDAVTLLIVIIIGGMLLRVLVGGVLLPLSGFRIDVGDFTAWAQRLAERGPGEFYDPSYFSDYPPGYLYVLWLLGSVGRALQAGGTCRPDCGCEPKAGRRRGQPESRQPHPSRRSREEVRDL